MERTYTLHDVLAVLKRRRGARPGVAGAVLVAGVVAALAIPAEWSSTSVVQIEPRRLPADFFPAQSGTSFEERMRTVKHGVLARPVLERVVRETDYAPELGDDLDERVSRLRRAIEVRLEGEIAGGPPGLLFVVEVRGRDREKIAKAAELLPRVYVELTRQVLTAQARSLRETLDAQAAALGKTLSEDEARILAFKLEHQTELPEMVETNARSMARVQALMDMRLGALADARRRRADVLAMIPEAPSAPGMAETGLDAAIRRVQAAEAAYGEDHPDVLRARRDSRRRRRAATASSSASAASGEGAALPDRRRRPRGPGRARLPRGGAQALQRRVDAAPRWGAGARRAARATTTCCGPVRGGGVAPRRRGRGRGAARRRPALDVPGRGGPVGAGAPGGAGSPAAPLARGVRRDRGGARRRPASPSGSTRSVRGPEDAGSLGVPVLAAIPRIGPTRGRV